MFFSQPQGKNNLYDISEGDNGTIRNFLKCENYREADKWQIQIKNK